MPRKKLFEAAEYDPIARDAARDEAIQASRVGIDLPVREAPALAVVDSPPPRAKAAPMGEVTVRRARPRAVEEMTKPAPPKRAEREEEAIERLGYIKKRFPLTKEEAFDLDEFVQRLRRKSGTSISLATVVRVCVSLGMQVEQELTEELERDPSPAQPAFQDAEQMAEFEEHWIRLFTRALRSLPQAPRRLLER